MAIIRFDPNESLFSWPSWLNDFENEFATSRNRGLRVRENDKNILIEAVVAGVGPKDVQVEIENGVLTIKAQAKAEERKKGQYTSSSYQYYYTTALSGGQWDKAKAEIKDGVVKVTIPKSQTARPKKITVKAREA